MVPLVAQGVSVAVCFLCEGRDKSSVVALPIRTLILLDQISTLMTPSHLNYLFIGLTAKCNHIVDGVLERHNSVQKELRLGRMEKLA